MTPPGYHVRTAQYFSRILRSGDAKLINPLSKTTMFEIKLIKHQPVIKHEIELSNPAGYKHKLKVVSPDSWKI